MAKSYIILTSTILLLVGGCTSSSPYSRLGNPTLEKVLTEHAAKVQSLPPKQDKENKTTVASSEQMPDIKHLERMYKDWVKIKPKLDELLEMEGQIKDMLKRDASLQKAATKSTPVTSPSSPKEAITRQEQKQQTLPYKYTIQVGATNSQASANKLWQQLQSRYSGLLNGLTPNIEKAMKDRKSIYRIKIGRFRAQKKAEKICDTLKQMGGQCLVKKL